MIYILKFLENIYRCQQLHVLQTVNQIHVLSTDKKHTMRPQEYVLRKQINIRICSLDKIQAANTYDT